MIATENLESRALVLRDTADAMDITDTGSLALASEFLRSIKEYRRLVGDAFDGIIETQRTALDEARHQKAKYEEPATQAETCVKRKIGTYHAEEEKKAREEAERQRAEARRAAEEETLKRAQEAEESGFDEAVDSILSEPVKPVPVIPVRQAVPKTAGVSVRTTWQYTIVDRDALPREYLMPDEKKIGAMVRAMKGETKIPGVQVFDEKVVSAR